MRPPLPLALLLLASAAGAAAAQTSDAPRPRRRLPPPSVSTAPATPVPAPAAPTGGRLALGGLPDIDDGGATCRSACARDRYGCEAHGFSCAELWNSCLLSCSPARKGEAGRPGATLLPR